MAWGIFQHNSQLGVWPGVQNELEATDQLNHQMVKALGRCYKLLSSQAICTDHQVLNVAQECTVHLTRDVKQHVSSVPETCTGNAFNGKKWNYLTSYFLLLFSILQLNASFLKLSLFPFFTSFPLNCPCLHPVFPLSPLFLRGKITSGRNWG